MCEYVKMFLLWPSVMLGSTCVTYNNVCKNTGLDCGQGNLQQLKRPRCIYIRSFLYWFIYLLVISAPHSCCLPVNFSIWQGDIQGEHWGKCSLGQSFLRRSSWSLSDTAQKWAVGILSLAPGSRFPCSTVRLSWVRRGNFFLNFVCIHTGRPNIFGLDW